MRKKIIAGNWKMNKTSAETKILINELKPLIADAKCEVVLCVPFTDLCAAKEAIKGTKIALGAQNVAWAESGAFTGEISAAMLVEAGVEYVVIGHSERRQYFNETDLTVNQRTKRALSAKLKPIVCVGETEKERESGKTSEVVTTQTTKAFEGISAEDFKNVVIAYEPIWAIGTGKTATSDDANDTIAIIRNVVAKIYDKQTAANVRIQYGGSMNAKNAAELLLKPEIDGGLIGGASLKAEDFAVIVNAAK